MTTRHSRRRCARTKRPGFTLAEILIAVGILGIGLAMLATLIVAGLAQVAETQGRMDGKVVAANGMSTARRKMNTSHVPSEALTIIAYWNRGDADDPITFDEQMSPEGIPDTGKGFIVVARNFDDDDDDTTYDGSQIVVIAYNKTASTNVLIEKINVSVTSQLLQNVSADELTKLREGSPVICAATGEYAKIVSIDGSTIKLNRDIEGLATAGDAWVFSQQGSALTEPSPVTAVLENRVVLPAP